MPQQTPKTDGNPRGDSPADIDKDEPCDCHRPSWAELVDIALQLATARDDLERVDRDQVELVAARSFTAYKALGGRSMTLVAWRARARRILEESRDHG